MRTTGVLAGDPPVLAHGDSAVSLSGGDDPGSAVPVPGAQADVFAAAAPARAVSPVHRREHGPGGAFVERGPGRGRRRGLGGGGGAPRRLSRHSLAASALARCRARWFSGRAFDAWSVVRPVRDSFGRQPRGETRRGLRLLPQFRLPGAAESFGSSKDGASVQPGHGASLAGSSIPGAEWSVRSVRFCHPGRRIASGFHQNRGHASRIAV